MVNISSLINGSPSKRDGGPSVYCMFDTVGSKTATYVVVDETTCCAAVIDSVLDFTLSSGEYKTTSADRVIALVDALGVHVQWILETHAHADHISAGSYLKTRLNQRDSNTSPPSLGISSCITDVISHWNTLLDDDAPSPNITFDKLFSDGDVFSLGKTSVTVLHTPGHTPACVTYIFNNSDDVSTDGSSAAAFCGDTLFMPDMGSARCDFPGGGAATLWKSIKRILTLPTSTRLFVGHDYAPGGREYRWETTVGNERAINIHVKDGTTDEEFIRFRTERDATLSVPQNFYAAVQFNMRGGQAPKECTRSNTAYIKIPVHLKS